MRWVSTRVLPEPAPARINSGPSPCTTASRWGGLRPASSSSILGSWAASGMPIHGTEQGGRVDVADVNGGWGGKGRPPAETHYVDLEALRGRSIDEMRLRSNPRRPYPAAVDTAPLYHRPLAAGGARHHRGGSGDHRPGGGPGAADPPAGPERLRA